MVVSGVELSSLLVALGTAWGTHVAARIIAGAPPIFDPGNTKPGLDTFRDALRQGIVSVFGGTNPATPPPQSVPPPPQPTPGAFNASAALAPVLAGVLAFIASQYGISAGGGNNPPPVPIPIVAPQPVPPPPQPVPPPPPPKPVPPPPIIEPVPPPPPPVVIHPPVPPPPLPPPLPPGVNPGPKADPVAAISRFSGTNVGCTCVPLRAFTRKGNPHSYYAPASPVRYVGVLTAGHCVSRHIGYPFRVTLQTGKVYNAITIACDSQADCALGVIKTDDDLPFCDIANDDPIPGTKIWQQGYGVVHNRKRVDGTVAATGKGGQTQMRIMFYSGDSGGPVYRDDTNELISLVSSTDNQGYGYGASVPRIRKMIKDAIAKYSEGDSPPIVSEGTMNFLPPTDDHFDGYGAFEYGAKTIYPLQWKRIGLCRWQYEDRVTHEIITYEDYPTTPILPAPPPSPPPPPLPPPRPIAPPIGGS